MQKSDFKAAKITGINVRVNQVNRIDVTLEVGAVAETINVVADAFSLERETGSLSTGVGRMSLENLPLNTRDVFRLTFLSPGTVPMRAYGDDYVGTAHILINGGRPMSNDTRSTASPAPCPAPCPSSSSPSICPYCLHHCGPCSGPEALWNWRTSRSGTRSVSYDAPPLALALAIVKPAEAVSMGF